VRQNSVCRNPLDPNSIISRWISSRLLRLRPGASSRPTYPEASLLQIVDFSYKNLKMFMITSQQSREDTREIGIALGLSDKTVETINSYPFEQAFASQCRLID
jgi:hypothetical protein